MQDDFLAGLGALALGSRLKRMADALMQDGVKIYQQLDAGFEPRWFPVFYYLHMKGPTSITGLAKGLGVSHPGINKIANELIAARLATPYRDRNDKRKRVLALTGEGKQKAEELGPHWRQIRQSLQSLVDESGGEFLQKLDHLERDLASRGFEQRFNDMQSGDSDTILIEPYRPEFRQAFYDLNVAWIEHYFTVEEADRKVLDDPEGKILAAGGEVLFAVDSATGGVLGTCTLQQIDDETGELAKMAVAESAKGRQLGRKLGEAIIDLARERGFKLLFLESNRKLTPALTLYDRLGFVEKPFPHPSDYSRANIYMELDLS